MISLALRHGADVDYIVSQLRKTESSLMSCAKCIARVLAKYTSDKLKGAHCFQCGSKDLKNEAGCILCKVCGHSECG